MERIVADLIAAVYRDHERAGIHDLGRSWAGIRVPSWLQENDDMRAGPVR